MNCFATSGDDRCSAGQQGASAPCQLARPGHPRRHGTVVGGTGLREKVPCAALQPSDSK